MALSFGLACGDDDAGADPEDASMADETDASEAGAEEDAAGLAPEEDTGTPDAGEPDAFEACIARDEDYEPDLPDPPTTAPAPEIDCGEPLFPDGTTLRRWPYIQSVTPTSARVIWTTTSGGTGTVRFRSPTGDWTEVTANAEAFNTERTEDSEDYVAFDAALTGLQPSSVVCYEVLEDGVPLATGLGFRTAWTGAGAETGERTVRILAFGDSGQSSDGQFALTALFEDEDYDLFLHLGDMAYGSGTFPEFEEHMFTVYRNFLHRVPSWPSIGNHEDKTDRAQPYRDVYYLPEQAMREDEQERYYSFDYGDVHFVSLDSTDGTVIPIYLDVADRFTDDMLDWLAQDLAASDATWKIAFFHHPPYSSSSRDNNVGIRNFIIPILEAGGVDLVLTGHDHHYERTLPIRNGCVAQRDNESITYIVAGAGGASLRGDVTPQWWEVSSNDEIHSYVELDISGCVATVRAIAADDSVIDTFELNGCE